VRSYSPERRTALVLVGTGAHGAYHAGVLRALQEAGVRIDVVAGQGIGAAGAALAAIDGASRLWDRDGIWRSATIRSLYPWRWPLRLTAWLAIPLVLSLIARFSLVLAGAVVPSVILFAPAIITTTIALTLGVASVIGGRGRPRRRTTGNPLWRIFGAPLDAGPAQELFSNAIWESVRGAAPLNRPAGGAFGTRYSEMLAENLGQPGFRELMLIVTDIDMRSDVVAAMLREPYRRAFVVRRPGRERQSEAFDLAGVGREHALDVVAAALSLSAGTDPHLVTFAADSYWRGETHRLCDRPGAVARLLTELSEAAVAQAIVVSAVPIVTMPHCLTPPRLDIRARIGELSSALEASAVRDAVSRPAPFDALFLICPAHNPVGPFDFRGAYDEASDRRQTIVELMERGYEDAYRQFIEPVVGASGEQIGMPHGQRVLDDADSPR
jgi:hypothetical protein